MLKSVLVKWSQVIGLVLILVVVSLAKNEERTGRRKVRESISISYNRSFSISIFDEDNLIFL